MTTVATIEARMTSSRLPGKVLLEADGEEPLLGHLINEHQEDYSIAGCDLSSNSNNTTDDVLESFAVNEGISCFRGSENNVLSRVISAAESGDADVIVEITGDCPIIDPEIIEMAIQDIP